MCGISGIMYKKSQSQGLASVGRDLVNMLESLAHRGRDSSGVTIVGEDEANPEQGKVSWTSPLAKSVHGASAGDFRVWRRPKGNVELEILCIR